MNRLRSVCLAVCALVWAAGPVFAQGVTSGALNGRVTDAQQQPVAGATVVAIHVPSGTTYEAKSRADGRFTIPGMRVGGPYSVTVAPATGAAGGFEPQTQDDITINLGVATDVDFVVRAINVEVVVTAEKSDAVFSSGRTGAATAITREALATLPTITGRLENITRLTPQQGGNMSFAGQDNRLNNITVDGAAFNNSFGLRTTPGETSGVAPISLQAIEQVQVSIAPFDVRQGNFVGAGVNTVTRSGTNEFRGSVYTQWRDNDLVGTKAKAATVNPGTFSYRNTGLWGGGPIVRNKGFFFGNYEDESLETPGTTFRANKGGEAVGGSVTGVLASDLDTLSAFLKSKFNYDTGPYQDYPFFVPAKRFLGRGDYNLNEKNKLMFRYQYLDSSSDTLLSNSSSLGLGTRRSNTTGLNFAASNYAILENIRTVAGEWNSILGTSMANSFLATYSHHDESRGDVGTLFPFVDILNAPGGSVYTSFGSEPFTPNNELRYHSFIAKDDFTKYGSKHTLTFGGSVERYGSENVFFSGKQSVYVYNSLNDFYTDANDYLANPNRTTSPVTLRRFQVRWMNIPGLDKPVQPLEVNYTSAYAQDNWRPRSNVTINAGVRVDIASFGNTAFANANADALTFRDPAGNGVKYETGKLPDASPLWSPRVGFNWDVNRNRMTQVRGGTGVFTGKPAFVWISNQVGTTGVLTGFEQLDNTTLRPFNPDPARYKPSTVTGAPASSYELALTEKDFKFPQTWRTNIAVDRRLPGGWSGTVEFLYNKDVNGLFYYNAQLPAPNTAFTGVDHRPRWSAANCPGNTFRIAGQCHVSNAVVLANRNDGRSWNFATSAERALRNGLWLKAAYSYGEAKNLVDPGSIAFGSWNNNQHPGDPNNPPLAYSNYSPGHRVFVATSYHKEYFKFGGTTVSAFWEAFTGGNASYTYATDLNGDGGTSNDLIYIPRNTGEMNFQEFTVSGRTFTAAEQATAWEAYIQQDPYLSEHRGEYAQRGAVFLPFIKRMDVSLQQDIFRSMAGRRHAFQFRVDVLNFGNLLNKNWGVAQRLVNAQPLTNAAGDANGAALYRLRVVNGELMKRSFEQTASLNDVYRLQFSIRYTFN
jgi:carboxypeptidase family protein